MDRAHTRMTAAALVGALTAWWFLLVQGHSPFAGQYERKIEWLGPYPSEAACEAARGGIAVIRDGGDTSRYAGECTEYTTSPSRSHAD